MERVIGHLDLDYFYAQVEEVENPSLKSLPVVVCVYSGRTEDSGVVSTANYKARELGVKSGIPIALAKRRTEATRAVFIPVRRDRYETYSERVMEVVRKHVDVMEQTGIDETFFELTKKAGDSYDAATRIASQMKSEILEEEGLTCSVGIAPNKAVAKVASDFRKPDGLTVVRPSEVLDFISPMSVEKLYGVGPKNAKILNDAGVFTVRDLAQRRIEDVESLLERKLAVYLWDAAHGIDEEKVTEVGAATQISRIITLKHDSREVPEIMSQLEPAILDVHRRVLEKGVFFRAVSVIGILKDLSTKTRSKTLEAPISDLAQLRRDAAELFASMISEGHDLRRAGIRVSVFSESQKQSSLAEFLG